MVVTHNTRKKKNVAGEFIYSQDISNELNVTFREVQHRCTIQDPKLINTST
jgi:hypothetical protein